MDSKIQTKVISEEFKETLRLLERSDENFFITGKAGTGKSTLLRLFRKTTKKQVAVLAPTGVAAINVGGQTIHSFFKFPPNMVLPEDIKRLKWSKVYKKLEVLIIDEISMVRADMIDAMDHFLRLHRNNDSPFGGVQLLFFGDMYQIPPVVKPEEWEILQSRDYISPYFFDSQVFITKQAYLGMIELTTVYRQQDEHFIRMLDRIREGEIDEEMLEELNTHVTLKEPERPYIYLTAYNASAAKMNQKRLEELDTSSHLLIGKTEGNYPNSLAMAPMELVLKEGAQVMILKNDSEQKYANGTIGIVTRIAEDKIEVLLKDAGDEKTISLEKHEWEQIRFEVDEQGKLVKKKVGAYRQFPLKLSWAITIHKSQGKTFDKVYIDLGRGAFASGQSYVALSRCRRIEGISLRYPITPKDIYVNPYLIERLDELRRQ